MNSTEILEKYDKGTLSSLERILSYLYDSEKKDYERSEEKGDHIFLDLEEVRKWVEGKSHRIPNPKKRAITL